MGAKNTKVQRPLNTVLMVGRVCQMPRLSTSRSGKPRLTVTLAVDRPEYVPPKVKRAKKDGTERVRIEPDFPVVVIEGDLARELAQQTVMGAILFVRGIFQTRNIEDRSANPPRHRVAMEVLANDARILESAEEVARQRAQESAAAPPAVAAPSPAVASQVPRAETVDSTVSIPKQVGGLP